MNGRVDLGALFDEHVAAEFAEKDVDATMRTMVQEPYVWHVPPLTEAAVAADGIARGGGNHPRGRSHQDRGPGIVPNGV
jgi:carboxymethylenebutenolidase